MAYKLMYLKEDGERCLGVNIPNEDVQSYLEELNQILSKEDFEIFTQNQKKRDKNQYHISVIDVVDYSEVVRKNYIGSISGFNVIIEQIFERPIEDVKILSLEKYSSGDNTSYFIICQSDSLNVIRSRFDLPTKDFHITLGFNPKDVVIN